MKFKTIICVLLLTASSAMALDFDSEVPSDIQKQMKEDLSFMYKLEGSNQTPYHKQIYGNFGGESYKKFFESHITSVGLDDCGGGAAVACVQPFFDPNKMWLTQNFIKFSHPQIARLMVVYHEARHSEGNHGNWGHDTCPTPFLDDHGQEKKSIWTGAPLAGEPACDSTAFGSYGSSTILLKNVAKYCTNCGDKVKMDADLYATDQLGRIDRADVTKAMLADFNAK